MGVLHSFTLEQEEFDTIEVTLDGEGDLKFKVSDHTIYIESQHVDEFIQALSDLAR